MQRLAHGVAARPAEGALYPELHRAELQGLLTHAGCCYAKDAYRQDGAMTNGLLSGAQDVYQPRGEFNKTKVAMTIHNIAFQVIVPPSCFFCDASTDSK